MYNGCEMKSVVYYVFGFLYLILTYAGPVEGYFVACGFSLAFFGLGLAERLSSSK